MEGTVGGRGRGSGEAAGSLKVKEKVAKEEIGGGSQFNNLESDM